MPNITSNNLPNTDALGWDTRTQLSSPTNGDLTISNNLASANFTIDVNGSTELRVENNALHIENGTNPQTLYIYSTSDGTGTNYERLAINYTGTSFKFQTEKGGIGSNRSMIFNVPSGQIMAFQVAGISQIYFDLYSTVLNASSIRLTGIPNYDPMIADAVWKDNGTLKISAGAGPPAP